MRDILVIGSIAKDVNYGVVDFPVTNGEAIVKTYSETHGGAAGNVAAFASVTFGRSCGLVSIVGNDRDGSNLLQRLANRDQVDITQVLRSNRSYTPHFCGITNMKQEKVFYIWGGDIDKNEPEELFDKLQLSENRLIFLCPWYPKFLSSAIKICNSLNVPIAFNPGIAFSHSEFAENIEHILPYITYLFLNKYESQLYSNKSELLDVLAYYRDFGNKTIIITDANNGAVVSNQNTSFFQPTYKVQVSNPVGSGDAFAAGFIASVLDQQNLHNAALLATQIGAYVATCLGSREDVPTLAQLAQFCNQLKWRQYTIHAGDRPLVWPLEV